MDEVPSLQQYCYDLLATYSGYIEDLSGVYISSIREICQRSQPFGLANIESLLNESHQDMQLFWDNLYSASPEKYSCKLADKVKGPGFSRAVILCSILRNHLYSEELDDEDLQRLLGFSSNLKILEVVKVSRLNLELIFSVFVHLVHVDLSGSKVGHTAGQPLAAMIVRNSALITLNLKSCDLLDTGFIVMLEPISQSRLTSLYLDFNELTLKTLTPLMEIVKSHPLLTIVEVKNNLKRAEVVFFTKLKNDVKKVKNNVKID